MPNEKNETVVTTDLSKFGYRELRLAAKLLTAYCDASQEASKFLGDGLTINMNTQSGYVFLSDQDYNVGMINPNTDKLEQWLNCPYCGHEGFKEDAEHTASDDECTQWMQEIGVLPSKND